MESHLKIFGYYAGAGLTVEAEGDHLVRRSILLGASGLRD
jgi:hypothetical protein